MRKCCKNCKHNKPNKGCIKDSEKCLVGEYEFEYLLFEPKSEDTSYSVFNIRTGKFLSFTVQEKKR